MNEQDWLAERFERHRTRLRAVSYRMLGSRGGAGRSAAPVARRVSAGFAPGVFSIHLINHLTNMGAINSKRDRCQATPPRIQLRAARPAGRRNSDGCSERRLELFLAQGYGATTIEQIAERAGVSKPTVFSAVGNKQAVMAAPRTVALRGDDEAPTVAEREPWRRVVAEPDPYRAVELEVCPTCGAAGTRSRRCCAVRPAAVAFRVSCGVTLTYRCARGLVGDALLCHADLH